MEGKKKETWRIIVALIASAYIIYMWVKKDIVAIYATMPKEEVLSIVVTTVAVTLLKVVVITAVILLLKWAINRISGKSKDI